MDQRTPRRLGLSPRLKPNTPAKRLNEATNTVSSSSKVVENIGNTPQTANDIASFETPTKKLKISLGPFDLISKQQTNDLKNENQHESDDNKDDGKTADQLKIEIQEMRERLDKYKKYNDEKKDLQQLIETWKAGGIRAIQQLQVEIQPKQEFEQILEHFQLPVDIFGSIID